MYVSYIFILFWSGFQEYALYIIQIDIIIFIDDHKVTTICWEQGGEKWESGVGTSKDWA